MFDNLFRTIDISEKLHTLDSLLHEPTRIVLAGSAVPILHGYSFRGTMDIDFAFLPALTVSSIISSHDDLQRIFDFNAQGIIGLLVDAEDRLVHIDLGLKNLRVECLSIMDWVVSKLASPKLEDVLSLDCVTVEMLLEIKSRFPDYCGVSYDRAFSDLQYLISMKEL